MMVMLLELYSVYDDCIMICSFVLRDFDSQKYCLMQEPPLEYNGPMHTEHLSPYHSFFCVRVTDTIIMLLL